MAIARVKKCSECSCVMYDVNRNHTGPSHFICRNTVCGSEEKERSEEAGTLVYRDINSNAVFVSISSDMNFDVFMDEFVDEIRS